MYSALERLTPINCTGVPAPFWIWLPTTCSPDIAPPPVLPPPGVLVGVALGIRVGVPVLVGTLVFVGVRVGVLVLAAGISVAVGVLVLEAATGVQVGVLVRVGVLVLLVAGTRVGVLDGTGVGVVVTAPGDDPVTLTEPAESFQVCWVDQSEEKTPTWIEYEPRRAFAGTARRRMRARTLWRRWHRRSRCQRTRTSPSFGSSHSR